MALAYWDDGEPSSVSHCRTVPPRHGRAFSTVLGCVLPLLDCCSFFLGFLQKIRLCWAESQRCLGPGFSELAFARLLHPTVLL